MKINGIAGPRAPRRRWLGLTAAAAALLLGVGLGLGVGQAAGTTNHQKTPPSGGVFVMTNEAAGNRVLAYDRAPDGALTLNGSYATGGLGTGRIRLSSQDPVVLSADNERLYVVNVGSDDISVFAVSRKGLRLIDKIASGGDLPYSLTINPAGNRLYALNNGGAGAGNITGFRVGPGGRLSELPGSTRPLSGNATDPAQVSFTPDGRNLIVTEKATNRIDTFAVDARGYATGPAVHASAGETPFGFDFAPNGAFIVTEATSGRIGEATTSSYALDEVGGLRPISAAVPDGQEEVCWTRLSRDGKHAYVTNFGNGTISQYAVADDGAITLEDPVAGFTTLGRLSIRDQDLSADGSELYAIDITSQKVHAWHVQRDGDLDPIGAFPGLPPTVAGLAAF